MHQLYIFHTNNIGLTQRAVNSVLGSFHVTLIDNSPTHELKDWGNVYTPPIPFTFLQSQKLIHTWAKQKGLPFYFWMHNDGELRDSAQRFIDIVENIEGKWGAVFTHYDVLCAYNTEALNAIGSWGDYFEQYFLDNHVYRLMRLAGYPTIDTDIAVDHAVSQTIHSDPKRMLRHRILWPFYEHMYELGWGGKPGHETYDTFFNVPAKDTLL
jgi:hypothetical protein